MLIYKDVVSGDELFSSAFDIKEVDGVVYEIDAAMINVVPGADVDIGANPSAEGGDDGALEEGAVQVNNVVYNGRLQPTTFNKAGYAAYFKSYLKKIKARVPEEEVPAFEKGVKSYFQKISADFKNFDFYTGEGGDPDGMAVLLNWREDGTTPYLVFWKHGLEAEKI